MRKPIIVGNWKMNKTRDEALQFIYMASSRLPNKDEVESAICAPSVFLRCLVKREGENLKIGAQNMHFAEKGAYTGELSVNMLTDLGVSYVILGHSERRQMFGETSFDVAKKTKAALNHKIVPIVCIGETLEQRESKNTNDVLEEMLSNSLKGIGAEQIANVVIAYEPIWAIGTGKTATAEIANEACKHIRNTLVKLYNSNLANKVRIQYGGSVKPDNIKELMSMEHIDGALVGGASLDAESFLKLFEF